jgi:hypothetical protein
MNSEVMNQNLWSKGGGIQILHKGWVTPNSGEKEGLITNLFGDRGAK